MWKLFVYLITLALLLQIAKGESSINENPSSSEPSSAHTYVDVGLEPSESPIKTSTRPWREEVNIIPPWQPYSYQNSPQDWEMPTNSYGRTPMYSSDSWQDPESYRSINSPIISSDTMSFPSQYPYMNTMMPNQMMSSQIMPNQMMSNQMMPNQMMPNQIMPNQIMPNQIMPNKMSNQMMPSMRRPISTQFTDYNQGFMPGYPGWRKSYTPMMGGCYRWCRPTCGRQNYMYGCRPSCKPVCNTSPSCGSQIPSYYGNTMVCSRNNGPRWTSNNKNMISQNSNSGTY